MTLYALTMTVAYRFDRPSGGGRQHFRITPASLPGRQILNRCKIAITPPRKSAPISSISSARR